MSTTLRLLAAFLFASALLAPAPLSAQCNSAWRLESFGCDTGHDNFGTLSRDGRPACGSSNCRGPNCWRAVSPSVSVSNTVAGSITVQSPRDVQVKGETHVWVPTARTVPFAIQFLRDCNLTVWINNQVLTPATSTIPRSGTYNLNLIAGDNVIEWTNYHQHASTGFRFSTQLANQVTAMHTSRVTAAGCIDAEVREYGCGPQGLNPAGSLSYAIGRPLIGSAVVLDVHNPLGTQTSGSLAYLLLSTAPMPQFPCGPAIPGWNMRSNSLPGDLLVSLAPEHFIAAFPPSGVPWLGRPASIALSIPNDPTLVGFRAFAQGFIIDVSPGGVLFGAATAAEIRIGV